MSARNLRLSGDVELVALKRKMGVVPVTAEQLIDRAPAKRNKYGAEAVTINGERFDSKGEAERYFELKMLERAGEISGLRRQVPFGLTVNGQLIATYIADSVYMKAGKLVVEDWKPGVRTDLYLHKKRHLLAEHGIEIFETGRA